MEMFFIVLILGFIAYCGFGFKPNLQYAINSRMFYKITHYREMWVNFVHLPKALDTPFYFGHLVSILKINIPYIALYLLYVLAMTNNS